MDINPTLYDTLSLDNAEFYEVIVYALFNNGQRREYDIIRIPATSNGGLENGWYDGRSMTIANDIIAFYDGIPDHEVFLDGMEDRHLDFIVCDEKGHMYRYETMTPYGQIHY